MKKLISLLGLSLALVFGSCEQASADNDRVIKFAELPATAQTFIKKHFPKGQVSIVKLDKELFSRSYEVILADGTKLEFDKNGTWTDIDGQRRAIPTSTIPSAIASYVAKNFVGSKVVQLERTDVGRYSVELDNGVELLFDKQFRFVGLDD